MKRNLKKLALGGALLGSLFSYVNLTAGNLVVNGYGEEGSSAGFGGSTFDGTDFAIGSGSFVYSTYKQAGAGDMIPLEQGQAYKFSFYLKSRNPVTQARAYSFLWQYDIDGNFLNQWNTARIGGTDTVLASPLEDGHDQIHLVDGSGWIDHNSYYVRGIKFWDYENSFGYKYPPQTYTRNYYAKSSSGANTGLWDLGTGAISGNTITLREPWSFGSKPAGTPVSQNSAGGHFYLQANFTVPEQWTYYEFIIPATYFSKGTAFIRPGWLMNYGTSGSETAMSGVRLEVIPQVPGLVSVGGEIGIGTDTPDHPLDVAGTIRAEEIIVEVETADYVFEDGYELRSLDEVEAHIAEHGHLPGVPNASDVAESGVSLGDSHRILLEKVEELTLYMIEQEKRIRKLEQENVTLRAAAPH